MPFKDISYLELIVVSNYTGNSMQIMLRVFTMHTVWILLFQFIYLFWILAPRGAWRLLSITISREATYHSAYLKLAFLLRITFALEICREQDKFLSNSDVALYPEIEWFQIIELTQFQKGFGPKQEKSRKILVWLYTLSMWQSDHQRTVRYKVHRYVTW